MEISEIDSKVIDQEKDLSKALSSMTLEEIKNSAITHDFDNLLAKLINSKIDNSSDLSKTLSSMTLPEIKKSSLYKNTFSSGDFNKSKMKKEDLITFLCEDKKARAHFREVQSKKS